MSEAPKNPRIRNFVILGIACVAAFFAGTFFKGETPPAPHDHVAETTWTCSMHPQIQSPEAGQCPICGMDLIPVAQAGRALEPNQIELTERAKTLARIRTTPVERAGAIQGDVHLLGLVEKAETGQKIVTAWTGGRIDRLKVKTTGQKVRRNQVIATLYSPEVYAAHRDLLVAREQVTKLASGSEFAKTSANASLESARQKLRLLGVPESEIKTMEKATKPSTQTAIRSPFAGTVTERLVDEGSYVTPGSGLYRISDLSNVWVQLDAYPADLGLLSTGQKVALTFNAYPDQDFTGEVAFIDPVVDPRTRTAKVRVEVPNPDGKLRPGMFAEAAVARGQGDGANQLVIPDTAPIFTGRRSVVYVEVPNRDAPTYASRQVRLGPKMRSQYPVLAGLNEGERVVTNGAFTLDADLQIRGGKSMMAYPDDLESSAVDRVVDAPDDFVDQLAPLVEAYIDAQEALAVDDLKSTREAIQTLKALADALSPEAPNDVVVAWQPIRSGIMQESRVIESAVAIDGARKSFEPLSDAIQELLRVFGNPTATPLRVAYCPMAFDNRGAEWVQRAEKVDNAYFGQSMKMCGEIRETVPAGGHLMGSE